MATKTTTVYRVQARSGLGPYRPDGDNASQAQHELAAELVHAHQDWDHGRGGKHPAPCDEVPRMTIADDELCGFASMEQLESWFAGFMTKLARARYWVVEYTVPERDVKRGRYQVVFNPRRASFTQKTRPH